MENQDTDTIKEPAAEYNQSYTYADYLQFTFDEMVEVIRGKIFKMSPAPKSYHQEILMNLVNPIYNHISKKLCKVFVAPFDVVLPIQNQKKNTATTVVQPDICVICDLNKIDEAGCTGPPDLIIEILSKSTSKKDLNDKYSIYEETGVREYWIVMPLEQLIEQFILQNGKYQRIKTYIVEETISPMIFPDLEIKVEDVFPKKA